LSYDTGVYQAGFETLGQLFDLQTDSNFGFVKRLNKGKVENAFRISLWLRPRFQSVGLICRWVGDCAPEG